MNTQNISKKLEYMIGKTYQYADQIYYIVSFKIDEAAGKCMIKTNVKDFDRPLEAIEEFLSYWSLASSVKLIVPIPPQEALAIYQSEQTSQADRLIAILEDNIEKVKTDPKFIPQATSINNNVNSIINIQKMKLAFMKKSKH